MQAPQLKTQLQAISKILVREFDSYDSTHILSETTTFKELGLDSLDVYTLISCVEEEFSIKISDEQLAQITSLGSLLSYLPDVP